MATIRFSLTWYVRAVAVVGISALVEKTVVPVVALAPKTLRQEMARALRVSMVVEVPLAMPLVAVVVALVLPELTVVLVAVSVTAVTAVMVFLRLLLVPL
jgi:hypothetical protein